MGSTGVERTRYVPLPVCRVHNSSIQTLQAQLCSETLLDFVFRQTPTNSSVLGVNLRVRTREWTLKVPPSGPFLPTWPPGTTSRGRRRSEMCSFDVGSLRLPERDYNRFKRRDSMWRPVVLRAKSFLCDTGYKSPGTWDSPSSRPEKAPRSPGRFYRVDGEEDGGPPLDLTLRSSQDLDVLDFWFRLSTSLSPYLSSPRTLYRTDSRPRHLYTQFTTHF